MTAEEIYQKHRSTLKITSLDISQDRNESMSDNVSLPVYNYDGVVQEYSAREHISKHCSNDALYIDENRITFIEFKNGGINKEQLKKKVYDSVLVLFDSDMGLEWCRPDFIGNISFSRKNIDFILVWENSARNPKDAAQKGIHHHLNRMGQFGLSRLKRYIYKNLQIMSKAEFQHRFVDQVKKNGCA